ncbi:MAG: sugar isomerase domain-containing protein [Victivallaceae bacterium]|nr:sugar isomerase domain-containing protein [Victivallaceae bacterium]
MKANSTALMFLAKAEAVLEAVAHDEAERLDAAAAEIAATYLAGGKIYIFGCTHSAILAEDVFYRAGAPGFWQPLWGPGMSIATTPGLLSSAAEKNAELGRSIVECSCLAAGDLILVVSTSGKNGAPVGVADAALKRGAKLLVIASSNYRTRTGNYPGIGNLWYFADRAVIIDNHVPEGDAAIIAGGVPMGPVSTIVGSYIMQVLSAMAVEKIVAAGAEPPVFLSSNAPGGAEHNAKLMSQSEMRAKFMLP